MRFLVTVRMPAETGNKFIADPAFGGVIEEILTAQKAEAVYFCPSGGQRGIVYVTDVPDGSHIPSVVEPWWLRLTADVTMEPVFNREEMAKAAPSIAAAVAQHGPKT